MMRALVFTFASWTIALCGCSCERESSTFAPRPASEALPRATRDDLPPATPALTITVREDGFSIDNLALVQSWPSDDRSRVENPYISGDFAAPGNSELVAPGLFDVLQRAADIERLRSNGAGTPIAYALRVHTDAPWRRVLQAIHTAGRAGFSEPRFILRAPAGDGEVMLVLPAPAPHLDSMQALELEQALRAIAASDPHAQIPAIEARAPRATAYELIVDPHGGIELRLGDRTLCREEASRDIASGSQCLDRIDRDARIILIAHGERLFGHIAPILDVLTARGSLELGIPLDSSAY